MCHKIRFTMYENLLLKVDLYDLHRNGCSYRITTPKTCLALILKINKNNFST